MITRTSLAAAAFWSIALAPLAARAEGVGYAGNDRSAADRVYGVATLLPTTRGVVSIGGSSIRRLAPGLRRWEELHAVPGDNLYRVATDDTGRLLAAWSKEPLIHVITADGKRAASLPKPVAPPGVRHFQVASLLFAANGRDAIVVMSGAIEVTTPRWRGPSTSVVFYRVGLEGTSAPTLLFRVDHGYLAHLTPAGAVFALPKTVERRCDHRECPLAAVVAYEITDRGVTMRTIFDATSVEVDRVRTVRGSDKTRVTLLLGASPPQGGRLLRWRYGEAHATVTPRTFPSERTTLFVTRDDRLLEFRVQDGLMEIWGEQRLANVGEMQDIDTGFYAVGERGDGTIWFHWGDHIGLFSPGRAPRGYSIKSLLPRRSEWTGDVYVKAPEELWVGIDDTGRHYVRVEFSAIERGARPWPEGKPVERTHGEYAGYDPKDLSTAERLYNATGVRPMAGGLYSLGGAALRRFTYGDRRWQTLHVIPKDNLYRAAADDRGRLLAAWENDPDIHLFVDGQHLTFRKPTPMPPVYHRFQVDDFAFTPKGDVLITTGGEVKSPGSWRTPEPVRFYYSSPATEVHRVALDGRFESRLLYREDFSYRIYESGRGTVFVKPKYAGQECAHSTCFPVAEIVAYEVTDDGVKKTTLVRGDAFGQGFYLSQAELVRGSNDDQMAMVVRFTRYDGKHWLNGGRGLLRWRWGAGPADYRPLPGNSAITPVWLLSRNGDFVELIEHWGKPDKLEIKRYRAGGGEQSTTVTALRKLPRLYGIGERTNGGLWIQWGDHLVLLSPDQPPRSFDMDALVDRGTEWAGALTYVTTPESLWVGLDGRGRRYTRLDFSEVEKRSKVWP